MKSRIIFCVLFTLLLTACGSGTEPPLQELEKSSAEKRPVIYTVNYPLARAAEQLAGDTANVVLPAPADIDPAFWEPDLDAIAAFQQADLVLLNGAGYAKWLAKVSLPRNRLVDTSHTFTDQLITVNSGPVHSHGPEGDHSHGELAFTVWLDLSLYAQQVAAISDALSGLSPSESAIFTERSDQLVKELLALDAQLKGLGEQLNGTPIIYSHPVYQYLERRYQLNGRALHWEPDQTPSAKAWAELDSMLSSHPARIMLWEDEPTPDTRAGLEQRGIRVVVLRPMGNRPAAGDFLSNLQTDIMGFDAAVKDLDKGA